MRTAKRKPPRCRDGFRSVVHDGAVTAGPKAADAKIKGTIVEHGRGDKVIVFKFKRKKQYKKTIGHRQSFTEVKVGDIVV